MFFTAELDMSAIILRAFLLIVFFFATTLSSFIVPVANNGLQWYLSNDFPHAYTIILSTNDDVILNFHPTAATFLST